ncbi:PDDEXK nuclease domain-containing protein [Salmonella enterica]|uniref:PDDEXK nuclease domain-containing protein n=1 Tax=Salmonella enterica TaxID=28901 RepID=UPI0027A2980E|nr:PDDEXK nuclease domain-containing protein [Salmonella enterica]WFQ56961.1 PDDEXK nuclease domain-containing protein [Salmonella enterica]WFQ61691.1 PDDEXK nuclease domain-containing protein [Salmonella enterica]
MTNPTLAPQSDEYQQIHDGIIRLVDTARTETVRSINAIMTATYWEIGRRIVEFEQGGEARAAYGTQLIERLSVDLSQRYKRGFSTRNLWQIRTFYICFQHIEIPQTLSAESSNLIPLAKTFPLPWSVYVRLLSVKNPDARTFYEKETLRNGWSVRQLDRQIATQFYERTLLSHDKSAMLQQPAPAEPNVLPEQAIRDPFILEFLNLKDEYSESDLEDALLSHLMDFMLELGDDFAFVGRQRRLRIDDSWFRVDLLFFHRRLRCLLLVDLKVGKFGYADAGQMNMYLNYAKEHWTMPGENPPVGLVLCAGKGAGEAHYALTGLPNTIMASEYKVQLPDEKLLTDELIRSQTMLETQLTRGGSLTTEKN